VDFFDFAFFAVRDFALPPFPLLADFFAGSFLRLVFAILRNSPSPIESAIWRDGPLSDDFDFFPRFAARAAPAAICCFFDFAGIV
jgi:hypothetical protein